MTRSQTYHGATPPPRHPAQTGPPNCKPNCKRTVYNSRSQGITAGALTWPFQNHSSTNWQPTAHAVMANKGLITRRSGVRSAPRAAVASSQDLLIDTPNDPLIDSSLYRRPRSRKVGSSLQSRELLAKEGVARPTLAFRCSIETSCSAHCVRMVSRRGSPLDRQRCSKTGSLHTSERRTSEISELLALRHDNSPEGAVTLPPCAPDRI